MYDQDYHQILQFSNHGIVATDEDGLITFVNKRAKEILQFGRKKVVGTLIWKHMPKTGKLVAVCLETGKPQSGVIYLESASIWLSISIQSKNTA
jgi:PAS domain S-box-containing protein